MYETTIEVEVRDEHWTLEIKTLEAWNGNRVYLAHSERRHTFVPISPRLYTHLERHRGFQREVEMNLDIEVAHHNQRREGNHWDAVRRERLEANV